MARLVLATICSGSFNYCHFDAINSLTIAEIALQDNGSFKDKVLNSSIFRVFMSKGHLCADVFYL